MEVCIQRCTSTMSILVCSNGWFFYLINYCVKSCIQTGILKEKATTHDRGILNILLVQQHVCIEVFIRCLWLQDACKQSWGFRQPSPSHSTYLLYLFTIKLYYNLPTHLYHLLYIFITIILSLFDEAIAITFVVLLPSFSNHLLYILPSHLTLSGR